MRNLYGDVHRSDSKAKGCPRPLDARQWCTPECGVDIDVIIMGREEGCGKEPPAESSEADQYVAPIVYY